MTTDLASKLRAGTQQAHTNAEHTEFMRSFVKGGIDKSVVGQLLGNLYYVYDQLETELNLNKAHPVVGRMYFPELNRTDNLGKDLTALYGKNWRFQVSMTPNAQGYVSRIREVSAVNPILLISHAYTRYMGDLSGGQSLKKVAREIMGLAENETISFYEFTQLGDLNEFKGKYREALNSLDVDEDQVNQMVEEAILAFTLNMRMMADLGKYPATV